ncbi:MAG: hypothetical protein LBB45_08985 [Methanobrevibacter sp.]|jgi:hypothetical protein|nr:hypothetical protein [Candidatus Methanovirga basalitermitum]
MGQEEYKIIQAYILYIVEKAKLNEMSDFENEYPMIVAHEKIIVVKDSDNGSFFVTGLSIPKV